MTFEELNLNEKLLRAVKACHFKTPTEIQRRAIPVALTGRDLMACAQTGTGKTAAFVLPALQRLLENPPAKGHGPRVLILTPTRELAMQVSDHIAQFSRFCRFTMGSIVGGLPYPKQIRLLSQPLDFLVATPGRLLDHCEQKRVDFRRVEILVLDEADRMLDMGFLGAVTSIADMTPKSRQTLLFSATLEGKVADVARKLQRDPAAIHLAVNKDVHASINQQMHHADDPAHKHALLTHLLKDEALYQAVVFTATKRGADRLAKRLAVQGHLSEALHGNMSQNARKRTLDRMRLGKFTVLVATDVAARGLDIQGISHVINFDLPSVSEDYIHRIGRTGRAGSQGVAVSLVSPADRSKLHDIEKVTGRKLRVEVVSGLEPRRTTFASSTSQPARRQPKKNGGWQKPAGRRTHSSRSAGWRTTV